jgi:siroheme synthase
MGLRQRKKIGTIDTIQETVAVNKLSSPAIIVIGEVVGDSKKSRFYEELKSNHNTVLCMERNELYPIFLKCTKSICLL